MQLTDLVRLLTTPAMWCYRRGYRRTFRAYMAGVSVIARGAYLAGLR